MLQQSLGDTASLHEIGIEMVAGNLVATPRVSDLFVNFGERIDVSDITGGFMFIAQTTNIEAISIYLIDSNGNEILVPGTTKYLYNIGYVYDIGTSVAKKVTIYGRASQQSQATISLYLVRNNLKDAITSIGTTFTDGNRHANIMVRELYVPDAVWNLLGSSGEMILLQARTPNFTPGGALITVADLNSYNSSTNLYQNYFYSHNYQDDVITLYGIGAFSGMTCYMVANWATAWYMCQQDNYVNDNEIIFNARLNKYVTTHLKFSPTISAFLNLNN